MHSRMRRRRRGVESMAGWVFADLMLVLFILGLGMAVAYTPPPEPEKEPKIIGMKTEPVTLTIEVDGGLLSAGRDLTPPERRAVCRSVAGKVQKLRGERAALVLVFGGASDVTTGQNVARGIVAELGCAEGKVFRGNVPSRAFWDGTLPLGKARLEVFLFLQQKSDAAA